MASIDGGFNINFTPGGGGTRKAQHQQPLPTDKPIDYIGEKVDVNFTISPEARPSRQVSSEVSQRVANDLLAKYSSDPDIQRRIDNAAITLVPVVNPDGYEFTNRAPTLLSMDEVGAIGMFGPADTSSASWANGILSAGNGGFESLSGRKYTLQPVPIQDLLNS